MCFHYRGRDLSSRNTLKMSEIGVGTAAGDIASSPEKKTGCGLLNAFFGRKGGVPRRSTSTGSIPTASIDHAPRIPTVPNSKRRRGGSDEAFLDDASSAASAVSESDHIPSQKNSTDRIISRPPPNHHSRSSPVSAIKPQPPPVPPPSINNPNPNPNQNQSKGYYGRKVPQGTVGLSGELESMIADHQKARGSSTLVRASSSNVMLFGNLGNLRQGGAGAGAGAGATVTSNTNPNTNSNNNNTNGRYSTSVMGNVVMKKQNEETEKYHQKQPEASLCRAISTRMDPEELKILGNEDYKNGRFAEALSLYEAAISIDPNKASYRSNKSAALTALGRLLEAAFECREAIRIEPQYQRAHNRLATLYVRLGEAENALYHYKHAGAEADPDVQAKAKKLQVHLNKCTEAKMQRDWKTLIRETGLAISSGADSAPQIFALKAEAYLKMHRYQDAEETMNSCPKFEDEECTKFFGPIGNAGILVIRAQIDQTAGRFEDAVAAAQLAVRLDPNNRDASMVARRTRAVATARLNGNELFKTGRFSEACVAYGEGLEHDPYNAVLLCNRAACRSKLGQHEKALEDCNSALNVRPSFSKARLRRGNCLAKLEKWEACIQDLETLLKETPDDEEIEKMLKEARGQLKKQRGGQDLKAMNNAIEIVLVTSEQCFRDYVTSSGISVVLFCNKSAGSKPIMQFLEQLQKRYSSVNFLKVEVEDQPNIAKSEGVGSLPAFKIYRNGSKTKDIPGNNHDLLESTIQLYIS